MNPSFIIAHLIGDFLLQNDWMQAKSKSSLVCTTHVLAYAIPFIFIGNLPAVALAAILAEHWLQDRFALHLKWMRFFRQTPADRWPIGPLCVDQAMHLAFIAIVDFLAKGGAS